MRRKDAWSRTDVFAFLSLSVFWPRSIARELTRRDDIWRTPRTMPVPVAESAKRVEIYVHGQAFMSFRGRAGAGSGRDSR